ncbi:hypothetical protein Hdeb2414_s0004g00128751 [Helianthus debilis subsp. tardiflorus]
MDQVNSSGSRSDGSDRFESVKPSQLSVRVKLLRFGFHEASQQMGPVRSCSQFITRDDSVKPSQLSSTRSTQLTARGKDWNIVECTLASHVLETTSSKS